MNEPPSSISSGFSSGVFSGDSPSRNEKILWYVPETRGGIRSYSEMLWPVVQKLARQELGPAIEFPRLLCTDRVSSRSIEKSIDPLVEIQPTIIHLQHEFGLFGPKVPPLYSFPKWLKRIRARLPGTRVVATAHTVLTSDYRYPLDDRGWQAPFRWMANSIFHSRLVQEWTQKTWGNLDGVLVHSRLQKRTILDSGCLKVQVVPHFVPELSYVGTQKEDPEVTPWVVVFGYFSPEKGQDIAIEAFSQVKVPAKLILAGGVRRKADRRYYERCKRRISELGLEKKVSLLGYVPDQAMDELYSQATLMLAPFRETSGSGSLVQSIGRGVPVLTSDLPLNREIDEREPGCLSFFKNENPKECAKEIERLLTHYSERKKLEEKELVYARSFSPNQVARRHLEFYLSLIESS